MELVKDKERKWEYVREIETINRLLHDKLAGAKFHLKKSFPPARFQITGFRPEGPNFSCPQGIELAGSVTLYTTLNRHLEFDFDVVTVPAAGMAELNPVQARISSEIREKERFSFPEDEVLAANFQIIRSDPSYDRRVAQVAHRVIYGRYEHKLAVDFPGIKIYDLADRNRPRISNYLDYCSRSILVEDASNIESYRATDEGFLDLHAMLEEDGKTSDFFRRLNDDKVNSLLVIPICGDIPREGKMPVAYIYVEGRNELRLDREAFEKLHRISEEIRQAIHDAQILNISEKQRVLNISEAGTMLEVREAELKKHMPAQEQLLFDLIFRLQAPLRFQGQVVHVNDCGESLLVGIDFEGSVQGPGKTIPTDRLRSLIKMTVQKTR